MKERGLHPLSRPLFIHAFSCWVNGRRRIASRTLMILAVDLVVCIDIAM